MNNPIIFVLVIILLMMLVGALPIWPHAATWGWGYYPSGLLGLVLLIVIIMLLMGKL